MNVSRKRYIQGFCIAVVVLGMVRCIFPSVAGDMPRSAQTQTPIATTADSTEAADTAALLKGTLKAAPISQRTRFFNADGTPARNRIFSVPNFGNTFPDQNDVQMLSARKHGVSPVADEHEAERRKSELVYIGANPYFYTLSRAPRLSALAGHRPRLLRQPSDQGSAAPQDYRDQRAA